MGIQSPFGSPVLPRMKSVEQPATLSFLLETRQNSVEKKSSSRRRSSPRSAHCAGRSYLGHPTTSPRLLCIKRLFVLIRLCISCPLCLSSCQFSLIFSLPPTQRADRAVCISAAVLTRVPLFSKSCLVRGSLTTPYCIVSRNRITP